MAHLFAYGMLQLQSVQEAILGEPVPGRLDAMRRLEWVLSIDDPSVVGRHHPCPATMTPGVLHETMRRLCG